MTEPNDHSVEQDAPATTLGVERWVLFIFFAAAAVGILVLERLIFTIWEIFDEPQPNVVLALAVVVSVVAVFLTYRRENVQTFTRSVLEELSKTTWPTRDQTWGHTVTVLAVSVVASVIVGIFDVVWSTASDYLYRL